MSLYFCSNFAFSNEDMKEIHLIKYKYRISQKKSNHALKGEEFMLI